MEVAVRFDPTIERHDRIVDGAGQFDSGHPASVIDGVSGCSVHLGGAAQRVRVLHPGEPGSTMRGDRAGVLQHGAHVCGAGRLTGMRSQCLKVAGEHGIRAREALDAHRRCEVGSVQQVVEVTDGDGEHPEHPVGSIDEGKSLLLA